MQNHRGHSHEVLPGWGSRTLAVWSIPEVSLESGLTPAGRVRQWPGALSASLGAPCNKLSSALEFVEGHSAVVSD